jgi:predicted heme/steroid binding protein/uncharacterized membrane protein
MSEETREFTDSQLKENDGQNGKPTYVSYKGKVYDVSESPRWNDGRHMGSHGAGNDLTSAIMNAPHDESLLSRFPVVGTLKQVQEEEKGLGNLIQKLHMHPKLVHFPIAYAALAPVLSLAYLILGNPHLESASYYLLIFVFLSSPVGGLTGYASWKLNYGGVSKKVFSRKKLLSILLVMISLICLVWRTINPRILTSFSAQSYLYLLLLFILPPISIVLGHEGGKLVTA